MENPPTLEQYAALQFRLIGARMYDASGGKIDTRSAVLQTIDHINAAIGEGLYPNFDQKTIIKTIFDRSLINIQFTEEGRFEIVENV